MNSPAVDIKDLLVEASLDLVFATNLFVANEPSKPDNCVTVYDTPGREPALTLDNVRYEYGGVQVRVRNTTYNTGMKLAFAIKDYLHGRHGDETDDNTYTLVRCTSAPAMITWDDDRRVIIVINFETQRR